MMGPVMHQVMQTMQDCITAAADLEHQGYWVRHCMQQGMFIISIVMLLIKTITTAIINNISNNDTNSNNKSDNNSKDDSNIK